MCLRAVASPLSVTVSLKKIDLMQECTPEVRAPITEFSYPQGNATVGKPFGPFYARAHIEYNSKKYNPAISFYYVDGPANSITVIDQYGKKWDLPKGYALVVVYPTNVGECTDMVIPGWYTIFPTAGIYQIQILSGYSTGNVFCAWDSRLAIVNVVQELPPSPSPSPWLPIPGVPLWVIIAIGAFFVMMLIGIILLATKK